MNYLQEGQRARFLMARFSKTKQFSLACIVKKPHGKLNDDLWALLMRRSSDFIEELVVCSIDLRMGHLAECNQF